MKRSKESKFLKYVLSVLCLIQVATLQGQQVPQYINYQGLVKDVDGGDPIRNAEIGIRVSILDQDFIALYTETHITTTTENGIYAIKIGAGAISLGEFLEIDWVSGERHIQVELDRDGTTNGESYELMGMSQILSVPYALVSDRADYAIRSGESDSSQIANSLISGYIVEQSRKADYADTAGFAVSISSDVVPTRSFKADTADYANRSGESDAAEVANSLISGYIVDQSLNANYADTADYATLSQEAVSAQVAESLTSGYVVEKSEQAVYADSSVYTDTSDYATISGEAVTARVAQSLISGYVVDQTAYADTAAYARSGVDADSTNEIQSLSFENELLSISGSNSVTIPIRSPRIQPNEAECTEDNAGLLRFEPTRKVIQYCDGGHWVNMHAAPLSIVTNKVVDAYCESASGSVEINLTGGQQPFSIAWSNGVTDQFKIENVKAGNYSVTITDGAGRSLSQTFTVNVQQRTIDEGVSNVQPNTVCKPDSNDPMAPDHNGQVTFTPTSVQSSGGFTFQLMTSDGVTVNSDGSTNGFNEVAYATSGSTSTVTGLPDDNYQMVVTDNETLCEITHTFEILADFTNEPVIELTQVVISDNTSCDATAANGQIDASGANVLSGGSGQYLYQWFKAEDTSTPIDNDAVLSAITSGVYILTITDAQLGCITSQTFTIADDAPVITAVESLRSSNTVCDPSTNDPTAVDANGTITFTPETNGVASGNYSFALETADGTAIPNGGVHLNGTVNYNDGGAGVATTTVTGLDGDSYVMIITDLENQCAISYAFQIFDSSSGAPSVSFALSQITNNASCDANAFTGQVDVSSPGAVVGGSGDYRYEWANFSNPTVIIDNDAILNGVGGGQYMLWVIDNQAGCRSSAKTVVVVDDIPAFMLGATGITDNKVCEANNNNPGANDANGSISFNPMTGGVDLGTYTFLLKAANGPNVEDATDILDGSTHLNGTVSYDGDNIGSSGTMVTGLDAGDYYMSVTDLSNGCSALYAFNIANDATDLPVITIGNITISSNTACGNGAFDGEANATASNAVTGGSGDYRYEWASATSPGVVIDSDAILNGVDGGDYILTVTDDQTGCASTAVQVTIGDIFPTINPVVSLQINNTVCDAAENDAGDLDANGRITFTPTTTNNIVATTTVATAYNFSLATAGGTTIVNGSTHNSVNISYSTTGSVSTVTGLSGGNYVMTITDADVGCDLDYAFTIVDDATDIPLITLENISISNNTTCDNTAWTGEANAAAINAVTGGSGDYRYEWAFATAPGVLIDNDAMLNGVDGGDYILSVIDDQRGCMALPVTVTVSNDMDNPTFMVDAIGAGSAFNTVCDVTTAGDYNGAVSITTTESGPYIFNWYDGSGTSVPTAYTVTNSSQNSVLSLAPAGTYTVNISNTVNSCDTTFQVTIVNDFQDVLTSFDISSDLSVTDDNSSISNNGTITFSESDLDVALGADAPANYLVKLYAGTNVSGTPEEDSTAPYSFTSLSSGSYTVEVVNPITGCRTLAATTSIASVPVVISAGVSTLNDNTVCDPANNDPAANDANGSITFTPETDGVSSNNYTFALATSDGTSISNGAVYLDGTVTYKDNATGSSSTTVLGLAGGSYVMKITDLDNSETLDHNFVIANDASVVPVITLANITTAHNVTCDNTAYTGEADASGAVAGGSGNYAYTWANTSDPATVLDNDAVLNQVGAGTYKLTVRDLETGCEASNDQVFIDLSNIAWTVENGEVTIVNSDDCAGNTGSLVINTITQSQGGGFPEPTSTTYTDFRFQWSISGGGMLQVIPFDGLTGTFQSGESLTVGSSVSATVVGASGNFLTVSGLSESISDNDLIIGGTTGTSALVNHVLDISATSGTIGANSISGLAANDYDVAISEANCSDPDPATSTLTVTSSSIKPELQVTATQADASCDAVSATGSATVDVVYQGVIQVPSNYVFSWFESDGTSTLGTTTTSATFNINGNMASNLPDGTYYVKATDNTSHVGCESDVIEVTINNDPSVISLTASDVNLINNTNCANSNGVIQVLSVMENGVSTSSLADYSFSWQFGGVAFVNGTDGILGNLGGGTDNQITDALAGNYMVTMTNVVTGCSTMQDFTLLDDAVDPVINLTSTVEDSSCDGINNIGDGSASVSITEAGVAIPLSDLSIEWYRGSFTAAPGISQASFIVDDIGSSAGSNAGSATVDGDLLSLQGLENGTYTIFVEKGSVPNLGCTSYQVITVGDGCE
ncbi:MAG: hypothetical protein R8G66_05620 [Cytophagales bacterium]|nr:hypothetical protein [Cytophagales bacterium]